MGRHARYLRMLRSQRGMLLGAVALGALAGAASGFGLPFFLQKVFREIFEAGAGRSFGEVVLVASFLPLVFLLRGITLYFNQYLLNAVSLGLLGEIRQQLFDKLQRLPLLYFDRKRSGDLLARILADTSQIQDALVAATREILLQPFVVLGGVGYLVYLGLTNRDAALLLVLLLLVPLMTLPVLYIGRHLRHRGRQTQRSLGELTGALSENLLAAAEVRAFNLEEAERSRFRGELARFHRASMKAVKYNQATQPLMEFVAAAAIAAMFVAAYSRQIPFETFAAIGAALFFTIDGCKRLVRVANEMSKSAGAFERIESILDEPETVPVPDHPVAVGRFHGEVRFDKVAFAYGDGVPALHGIDLTVRPGTVCALVGPSGAGKSTFTKLVPRFYDVSAGALTIDGTDVRRMDPAALRGQIALVPQSPVLFNTTILENIRIGRPEATREEIVAAARAAYADEFITELPGGYEAMVGENARRLSGGQRQRLALARTFLRDAPILILDEATSALDAESEQKIQEALAKLCRGRTVFIVAHRFSTIRIADRILLFDQGGIAADGDFETMMREPVFRRLYEKQTG
jgi:ATP-binding cassette, subfamily B, bacterial MsbA